MGEIKDILIVVAALASPVAVVVTLRAQARFSEWRHEQHEKRLEAHDLRIRTAENDIAGLKAGKERAA